MMDIVIHGIGGRMGQAVAAAANESADFRVVGGVSASGSVPSTAGCPDDIRIATTLAGLSLHCDLIVDFSSPEGLAAAAEGARERGVPLVTGTTGLDEAGRRQLESVAREIAVVAAPNFSVGITLLLDLVERAAGAVGPEADVEILEAHHRDKADAPSGTALRLGEAVASRRGRPLEDLACYDRRAERGPRAPGSIGFAALRAGDIVGEHQVLIAMGGERLELGHRASDRGIFAHGALRAAGWVADRAAGLYDMRDVLGLKG